MYPIKKKQIVRFIYKIEKKNPNMTSFCYEKCGNSSIIYNLTKDTN